MQKSFVEPLTKSPGLPLYSPIQTCLHQLEHPSLQSGMSMVSINFNTCSPQACTLKSIADLRSEFEVPTQDLYKYLQIRHLINTL